MSIMPSAAATGRDHPYKRLEIQMMDLKAIDFDQPGLRVIALQNDFAPEDMTSKAQPLAAKAD